MMPTLSSLVASEVMTTSGATSDDKVGIMTTLTFLCKQIVSSPVVWYEIYPSKMFASFEIIDTPHCLSNVIPSLCVHIMAIGIKLNTLGTEQNLWQTTCSWGQIIVFWLKFDPEDSIQNNTLLVNSLRPSDAYIRQKPIPSLVQIMVCRLFGAKPSSEPMLEYCQLDH